MEEKYSILDCPLAVAVLEFRTRNQRLTLTIEQCYDIMVEMKSFEHAKYFRKYARQVKKRLDASKKSGHIWRAYLRDDDKGLHDDVKILLEFIKGTYLKIEALGGIIPNICMEIYENHISLRDADVLVARRGWENAHSLVTANDEGINDLMEAKKELFRR